MHRSPAAASGAANAISVSGQGTWETTLQGRDLNGDGIFDAYYDTVLDITWLADANYAMTSGYDADGRMTWSEANAWADGLTFGGYTDWRLPTLTPINGVSFNNTEFSNNATTDLGTADADGWVDGLNNLVSEMGHMFYVTLGNLGLCTPNDASPGSCTVPTTGWGLTNTGPFSNVQTSTNSWSGMALDSSSAWNFGFGSGGQGAGAGDQNSNFFAWAVYDGDVGASVVPVPAAAWLFASGLLGLVGVARKRRR